MTLTSPRPLLPRNSPQDIKPANFGLAELFPSFLHMLDPSKPRGQPRLRVLDFGCCQEFESDACLQDMSITGTPLYMVRGS